MPTKNNRRKFIKSVIVAGTTIGVGAPLLHHLQSEETSMVPMLMPDGTLVMVKKSALEQNTVAKKATEKEVFDWMNDAHKK
ncbi:hypothetical protein [Pinibacter aurantiacus]|uniref:Twin-arginine translocation signal domain-containing protein n=1 Tax=Pinibacter aurantiacus TaxID=2851599 RepID=A0A9E2S9P2_9BACT|nr:hypothetical protein [Pinibacter aurantiacus]MBV4357234.1 hypothetical protein [Pinibacter aurantiacus]